MNASSEKGYPFRGYLFDYEGYHDGGIWLETDDQLENFIFLVAPAHMHRGLEVMVTDCWDFAVFHAKNGRVVWPSEEVIDEQPREE